MEEREEERKSLLSESLEENLKRWIFILGKTRWPITRLAVLHRRCCLCCPPVHHCEPQARVRQSARAREVRDVLTPCKSVHHVEIPSDPDLIVSPVYLKKNILEAVRSLFGEEGAKSPVDILKLSPEKRRFVLRCPDNSYVRLRASLTLSTKTFQHGDSPS
ncbi:PREDICTED: uncharacterized protein LOC108757678 isoform X3 [Trachymyrmex cornetzi]|uniref:uncharacterized protein LOC108757678 isoform X3 n=1 Tax=Trachymyrmex cornetzi TaxID=471704 RepID=UPI00084F54A8|nr:PREDICTED: uncharacterized protein LOC108757678 isoform X3 [Trachymyrmex cornetzi]